MVQSGLVLVDKPAGFTSHDVVAKSRRILGTRKIGHAGTLDPMATGLLVLGVEAGTKLLTFIVGQDKTYEATIRLGVSTVTDDAEGEVKFTASKEIIAQVTTEQILEQIKHLTGNISQRPSSVSAIKVAGVRAYDKVRNGEEVELASREVIVSRFDLTSEIRKTENWIDFDVVIDCSSGTYIRALARDIGLALKLGGHLTALRRTRIGDLKVVEAQTLEQLEAQAVKQISLLDACREVMPVIEVDQALAVDLHNGKRIAGHVESLAGVSCGDRLIAIVESAGKDTLKSVVVFSQDKS